MEYTVSLESWNYWAQNICYGTGAIAILILLVHVLRLAVTKDAKTKYDYINASEISLLWYVAILIIISVALYVNTFSTELTVLLIFVRSFVTIMMSLIVGVIVQNSLKFYYPFYVEKRLKKLRYQPRISPKTGKAMKLLSEEEEDVYLDEGMQAEENVYSIDYDVWVDEETGYTKIEKYAGHLHAIQCPECNYQTLRVTKEEVVVEPTNDTEGELEKYFDCSYCGYKTKKSFHVAKLSDSHKVQEASI